MWRVARNYVTLLLIVASVWTLALWAALWQMVIRPVRRLTSNIIAFGEKPQEGADHRPQRTQQRDRPRGDRARRDAVLARP